MKRNQVYHHNALPNIKLKVISLIARGDKTDQAVGRMSVDGMHIADAKFHIKDITDGWTLEYNPAVGK